MNPPPLAGLVAGAVLAAFAPLVAAPVTTTGFLNLPRAEAPGTLLSHPAANGSQNIGRTTTLNYLNGWLIVGAEVPGSADGSDLSLRVYDIANPAAPVRRHPSDFELSYPNNRWYADNHGFNAHGTAQSGPYLLPWPVLRVASFGAPVELGGTGSVPEMAQFPVGYNRSSQAGPWSSTLLWYGSPDQDLVLERVRLNQWGYASFQTLATFDHVGEYGGGDWHPIFFGDLLIYVRSGGSARDGVVVYRLPYQNMEDANPANDAAPPQLVAALPGGFQAYWPTLFSDGSGLYVIGSTTDILTAADLTTAAEPGGEDAVTVAATLTVPGFSNASYPTFQDQFGFIHNRKVNMTAFLAGDPNPIVLTLQQDAPNNVDTSQMSLPLGNLWITGGYPIPGRSQGMAVWVHQQAADTTPPQVTYHIPQANRTNYPRSAPLSFLLHEHPRHGGMRNGIDFAVRPVNADESLGAAVAGFLIHDFSGVVTFTPNAPLAANTTYQVDFLADAGAGVGFVDAAGNRIAPYTFRFSTGAAIAAEDLPSFASLTASDFQPVPGETVTVTATAAGVGPFDYRFNFAGQWSEWSDANTAQHAYAASGRPRVLVQVRDANGAVVTDSLNLLVHPEPAGPRPTQSAPLAVGDDPGGRRVWVVNPDANTVSVLDAATGAKLAEHGVGKDPRSIARDANGRYWVTCQGSDELRVLNPDGTAHAILPVPYGARPFGVAASPDGEWLFVTLTGSGHLRRYRADVPTQTPVARATFPTPRAIAVSGDGQRVLVTRFLSPDLEAEVGEFAGQSADLALTRTFRLSSANTVDGGDRAAGVPNYLAGIAISPDGTRAAIASKQDNVLRGPAFGVGELTHETTVRSVVSFLNLQTNAEIRHSRRDIDNSDSPAAITYSPRGDLLLVALQGTNRVVGIDTLGLAPVIAPDTPGSTETSPAVLALDLETGRAPQGVLLDAASGRLFTHDFLGRSVTVRDAGPLLTENRSSLALVATTATVATELLPAVVLAGKRVFYNAADPRMSADSYLSCATCHLDGGHDGRTFDFTHLGEGFRRTTDLRGRAGVGHGNVHWSANFDEIQDFEHIMRRSFGGTGFLPLDATQFQAAHPGPQTTKAGLNAELDALAAYVASLGVGHVPRSPHRNPDGSLTPAGDRGRDVFVNQGCATCHAGDAFTDSAVRAVADLSGLRAVGTLSGLSGGRLGQPLTGVDPPSLLGLHAARTYLHHGLAPTLGDVFTWAGGTLLFAAQAQNLNPGPVYTETDSAAQGGGGFVRGTLGGALVHLTGANGNGIRFSNVDGGPAGGAARIAVRYMMRYFSAPAQLRVNGANQNLALLQQTPDNNWQISGWRWITANVTLQPGATNTIELRRLDADFAVNAILVANAPTLAAAAPHHVVAGLPAGDRDDLLAFLRQIDGRNDLGVLPSGEPTATIAPVDVAGGALDVPFVDFDVTFTEPVTGLDAGDFVLGGTAGATLTHVTALSPTTYRLRVAGFFQSGTLTVTLPWGAVVGGQPGSGNVPATGAPLTYTVTPPPADGLRYAQWLGVHFPPAQLVNPSLTAPAFTPPGHRLPNVLQFLLGATPGADDTALVPALTPVANGGGEPAMRYLVPRNPLARGYRLTVETSPDLVTWTVVATSDDGAGATGAGVHAEQPGTPPRMVIGPGGADGERRFYRVRATPLE